MGLCFDSNPAVMFCSSLSLELSPASCDGWFLPLRSPAKDGRKIYFFIGRQWYQMLTQ